MYHKHLYFRNSALIARAGHVCTPIDRYIVGSVRQRYSSYVPRRGGGGQQRIEGDVTYVWPRHTQPCNPPQAASIAVRRCGSPGCQHRGIVLLPSSPARYNWDIHSTVGQTLSVSQAVERWPTVGLLLCRGGRVRRHAVQDAVLHDLARASRPAGAPGPAATCLCFYLARRSEW